jgi:uncharacterized membrane protein
MFYGFCPFAGYGILVLFGVFLLLAGTALLILRRRESRLGSRRVSAKEMLDRRLARKEISEHEYRRIKEMMETREKEK